MPLNLNDMGFFNYSFGTKDITEEKIRDFVTDKNVKRICFSRIQTHALWRTPEGEDMITVPFVESIGAMLKENTGIVLRNSRNGNYYKKLTGDEYIRAKASVELCNFFITLLHNGISIPPKLLPSIITNRYNNVFKLQVDDTEK